jgi:hypothetical protein
METAATEDGWNEVFTIQEIWHRTPPYPGFQTEIIDGVLIVGPHGTVRHALINHASMPHSTRSHGRGTGYFSTASRSIWRTIKIASNQTS